MTKRAHYFDRYGREVAEHEAMRNGTLRDQFSMRVPTVFRDSRFRDGRELWDSGQLVCTDADATGRSGNAPGWRVSDSPINRQAIVDAYADYRRDLESAWRSPPRDAFGSIPYTAAAEGGQCTVDGRPGRLVREGSSLVCRPIAADAAKPRRDPEEDDDDEDEDDDDMPQGELEQMTSATDRRTVDQMSHDHQQRMSKIYSEHSLWLANQYKSKG